MRRLLEHLRRRIFAAEEDATGIDEVRGIPRLDVAIPDVGVEPPFDPDAGIVHHHIESATPCYGALNERFDLLSMRDITLHKDCLPPGAVDEVVGEVGRLHSRRALTDVGTYYLRAFSVIREGDCLADARRRAGDDGDFVLKSLGHVCILTGLNYRNYDGPLHFIAKGLPGACSSATEYGIGDGTPLTKAFIR